MKLPANTTQKNRKKFEGTKNLKFYDAAYMHCLNLRSDNLCRDSYRFRIVMLREQALTLRNSCVESGLSGESYFAEILAYDEFLRK